MKKKAIVVTAGIMCIWLAACGQAGGAQSAQTEPSPAETVQETQIAAETETSEDGQQAAEQTESALQEGTEQESAVQEETDQTATESASQGTAEEQTEAASSEAAAETQQSGGYEDNFAVDSETAAAFGKQIQEAVAAQNLEALADLTAYPVYVGFQDGSVSATSREEFVALGTERIFTPELMESVGNADVNSLSPSMAGFALSTNDGPNIIFSVVNGALAIQGINY